MPFPNNIREQVLIASSRRCCVCRQYKGVGVEVHHIIQEADGGPNTLDNAIVLCFDCHAAAGHYNPRHPKGTKFSPSELRRHRDDWFRRVAAAGIAEVGHDNFDGYLARHLLCLDTDAARELLTLERGDVPFSITYIHENEVTSFMREVVKDDLPLTWQSSGNLVGHHWHTSRTFETEEQLLANHPEYGGNTERPLARTDFSEDLIPSRLLRKAIEEGFDPKDLGTAVVYEEECGGGVYEPWTQYYCVRRPLFLFLEIKNISDSPITIEKVIAETMFPDGIAFRSYGGEAHETQEIATPPLKLIPGENLFVPQLVLWGPKDHDDLRLDYNQERAVSREQGEIIGFRCGDYELSDFLKSGPEILVTAFRISVRGKEFLAPVHRFDPNKCYMMYRAWYVGSCPHLFFKRYGRWNHWGEILSNAFGQDAVSTQEIMVPSNADRAMILETDMESSTLTSILLGDEEVLRRPKTLLFGDRCEFRVKVGEKLRISGFYVSVIRQPNSPIHLRQKKSLFKLATECAFPAPPLP